MVTELHIFRFAENAHCGWLGSFAQFTQPVVQPAVFIQLCNRWYNRLYERSNG